MKRRLILMRHGEAEEAARGGDPNRRLTSMGKKAASRTAKQITELKLAPTAVFVSDAQRTRETSECVAGEPWATDLTFAFKNDLYLTGWTQIKLHLQAVADDVSTVLFIGHNPGFSDAASMLTNEAVALRPADAAVLGVEAASWVEASTLVGDWALERHLTG